VGFFLGVVKNGFVITAILVLSAILPGLMEQASQAEPLLQLGSLFLVISVVYLFYDLATAIGLILRKGWGWWLTVIGLAWTACERVFSAVTFVMLVEEKAQAIGAVIGASVVMIICLSLLNFMVQPETQKRFGVDVKPGIVWVVALAVGLLLSGIAYGIGMAAGLQLEQALPTPPPVPPPG
jgi:hypothetical protein